MIKRSFAACALLLSSLMSALPAAAQTPTGASQNPVAAQSILDALQKPQFLPVDQAFMLDFIQNGDKIRITFQIADGYYLYKHKLKLAGVGVNFSNPELPAGLPHEDEYFGKTEIYRHQLLFDVALANINTDALLKVRYQGCAEAGLCYPVETRELPLIQPAGSTAVAEKQASPATGDNADHTVEDITAANSPVSAQIGLAERLTTDRSIWTLALFFLLGLGLAFTPCVFPMYPILTSIIVGQGQQLSTGRAFRLSMAYVQGMALTYSALGLVVASAGVKFQAMFQHPAVLAGLSLLFVALAGAMFGWYNLQLPARWTEKLTATSNNQQGGSVKGALVMGALSGLVASPCTTAPLTGVLLFIAQSGDLLYGALVLYILSLGMGLPLLLLGSSGGKWLPKPGAWMDVIKTLFGFLLLSVPLMLLSRILSSDWLVVLGSLLALLFALYIHSVQQLLQKPLVRSLCWFIATSTLVVTFWWNQQHWWPQSAALPLSATTQAQAGQFIDIKTLEDLDAELKQAQASGQYVMLDLFAEWCVACKEFEHITFADPAVKAEMAKIRLLRIDVTKASQEDQRVLDRFQVLGLPTLLFFAPNGDELTTSRITGFMGPAEFGRHLQQLQQ